MSEIQEIDIIVLPDGTVKIDVRGVKGQKCLDITKGLESVLSGKIILRNHKPEFYENEDEQQQDNTTNLNNF